MAKYSIADYHEKTQRYLAQRHEVGGLVLCSKSDSSRTVEAIIRPSNTDSYLRCLLFWDDIVCAIGEREVERQLALNGESSCLTLNE